VTKFDELTCPCCSRATLHLERLTARCAEPASPAASTVVLGFGGLDNDARRIWRSASSRGDGVALRFTCESCHTIVELAFAVNASSTAVGWHEVGHAIAGSEVEA
jgi:hypothetical protein